MGHLLNSLLLSASFYVTCLESFLLSQMLIKALPGDFCLVSMD